MKTLCMLISFYQFRLDFVCRIFYHMAFIMHACCSYHFALTDAIRIFGFCIFAQICFWLAHSLNTFQSQCVKWEWEENWREWKEKTLWRCLSRARFDFDRVVETTFFRLPDSQDVILSFGFWQNLFLVFLCFTFFETVCWEKVSPKKKNTKWKKEKKHWNKLHRWWFCGNICCHNIYPFLIAHTRAHSQIHILPLQFMILPPVPPSHAHTHTHTYADCMTSIVA